jgi:hypothetical protein
MRFLATLLLSSALAFAQSGSSSAPAQLAPSSEPSAQENAAKAKALLDQTIQALGGSAYLNAQDSEQVGRTYTLFHGRSQGPGVQFWRFTRFPDKDRIEVTKQRDVVYVYRGDRGYEITYKGTAELDLKPLADYLRRRDHSLDWVLKRWIHEPGVALLYEGTAIAADKPADKVTVINAKNDSVTLFLDSGTHLPIKTSYSWRDPADRLLNTEEEVFDAYRPTQGIMTPYNLTRFYNGEMSNQRFLNTVTYNQNLNDSLFDAKASYDPAHLPEKKK